MPYRVWPTAASRAKPSGGSVVAQPGAGSLTTSGFSPVVSEGIFPLSVSANGRYLQQADGVPFFVSGDVPYSLTVQCTRSEVDTYLDDMVSKGFNAGWISFIEHKASDNTPRWRNKEGEIPFTSGTDFGSMNESYWGFIDYVVQGCHSRGILIIVTPAYWGITSVSEEGWDTEVLAESDADLQSYGAFLANRYKSYGNLLFVRGGDQNMSLSDRTKQNNIFTGIQSAWPAALITAHATTGSSSRDVWPDDELDLDLLYRWEAYSQNTYEAVKGSYDLSPVMPALFFEGQFEGSADAAQCRRQAWQAVCSGSPGHVYGHSIIWHFSSDDWDNTPWSTQLNSTGRSQMQYVKALAALYSWHLLVPKDDTSVISSSLGTGTSRVCPAIASDGSFAWIWVPSSQTVTLVKSAFSPSSIRVRLYDPTNGTFSTHTASTSNSGTLSVATGGERVVVVDAA